MITEAEARALLKNSKYIILLKQLQPVLDQGQAPDWAIYCAVRARRQMAYSAHYSRNNAEGARQFALEALPMARQAELTDEAAKITKILGIVCFVLGDMKASEAYNRECLELYRQVEAAAESVRAKKEVSAAIAKQLWGIAQNAMRAGDLSAAAEALDESEQRAGRSAQLVRMRMRLALISGRPEEAFKLAPEAAQLGKTEVDRHALALLRTRAHLESGQAAEAREAALEALSVGDALGRPRFEPLFRLGQACEAGGDLVAALAHYTDAAGVLGDVSIRSPERMAAFLKRGKGLFDRLVELRFQAGDHMGALAASHAGRARFMREMIAGSGVRWAAVPEEARRHEAQLRQRLIALGEDDSPEAQAKRTELENERREAIDAALDRLPAGRSLAETRFDPAAFQKGMAADATMVALHALPGRTLFWIIGADRFEAGEMPLDARGDAVRATLAMIEAQQHNDYFTWYLDHVVAERCRPLTERLPAGEGRITFVPPPALWAFPFQMLRDGTGQRLSMARPCSYLPSMALANRPQPARVRTAALVVGNPLGDLPHATEEAMLVAKLLNTEPLIGKAATREAVMARLPEAGIVHFACHGRWVEGHPDLSGLELADGRLSLHDLLGCDLSGVRLLSLLSCETGKVSDQDEEAFGPACAALASGCGAVMAATAPVRDAVFVRVAEGVYQVFGNRLVPESTLQQDLATKGNTLSSEITMAVLRVVGYFSH